MTRPTLAQLQARATNARNARDAARQLGVWTATDWEAKARETEAAYQAEKARLWPR